VLISIPAAVKLSDLIKTLAMAATSIPPTDYTRADIDRLGRSVGYLNQKLSEHEASQHPLENS